MTLPDRSHIQTEQNNPASAQLDLLSIPEAVKLFQAEDRRMVAALESQAPAIAEAVLRVSRALQSGGRLIYLGAGTSGRLGVLDASECPPTFCSPPEMVQGFIAGGDRALRQSLENVEDDRQAGAALVEGLNPTPQDLFLGIAAGGTTPYVHGGLAAAQARGATTVFLACTAREHIDFVADVMICLPTGPELLTGSTRLKAGTATKMVLNTITTLAMVQLGKVYGNQMVDIDALKNRKLVDRGARMISQITGVDRARALELLELAGGKVKRAIVMQVRGCSAGEADEQLAGAGGHLRRILG